MYDFRGQNDALLGAGAHFCQIGEKAKHAGLGLSSSDDQQALSSLIVASGSQYESDDVYKFSDITDCASITGTPDTR